MLAAAISGLRRTGARGSGSVPSVGPVVHPGQQAEGEHVLRSARPPSCRGRSPASASRVIEVSGTLTVCQPLERAVLERVGRVADLGQVARGELVGVDDEQRRRRAGRRGWPSAPPGSSRRARPGASPGVMMSWSAKCSWKELTPGQGARRARGSRRGSWAGSTGRCRSDAVSLVNRLPVSCMPSPESPANRMTTRSSSTTLLRGRRGRATAVSGRSMAS